MYYLLYLVVSNFFLFDYKNNILVFGGQHNLVYGKQNERNKMGAGSGRCTEDGTKLLTLVVQMVVSASHWINHYSADEY